MEVVGLMSVKVYLYFFYQTVEKVIKKLKHFDEIKLIQK